MDGRIHVDSFIESDGKLLYKCFHPDDRRTFKYVEKEALVSSVLASRKEMYDVVVSGGDIVRKSGAPVAFVDMGAQSKTIAARTGLAFIKPEKERLIMRRLREFIERDTEYSMALLAGIRLTGKTTILRQLNEEYPGSVYIDLSIDGITLETIEDEFLDRPERLLLLDEITYLDDFEPIAQRIYNLAAQHQFKVIVTGSSPAHLTKLSVTKLGGRARLFRLPPILFIEYLYLTARIPSYENFNEVTNSDFADYLQLKGLNELRVQFDAEYFNAFYSELTVGNTKRGLSHSLVELKENDLMNMCNLIAYRLSEDRSYEKTIRPKEIGRREYNSLKDLGDVIVPKWGGLDLSDVLVSAAKVGARKLPATDKARILSFLLWSGLATIEKVKISETDELIETANVLGVLKNCANEQQLFDLFDNVSICLATPLFYTRLGNEIITRMNVDVDNLCRGDLLGKMLEVYARGVVSMYSPSQIMSTIKLRYANIGEVDIADMTRELLLEVTIQRDHKVNIGKYFEDTKMIRVCTTRDKEYFNNVFYQIPYAKLCCMLDTGDILNLQKTCSGAPDEVDRGIP